MRARSLFNPLVLVAALQACSAADVVTGPGIARSADIAATLSPPVTAEAGYVARGIALAMNDPSVRAHLRVAMRDSRWTDHKLDLHSYVATRQGQALVAAAAARLGTSGAELDAMIARLPVMDVYLPFRDHRIAWRGLPGVLVAASFAPDAPTLRAYRSDGSDTALELSDGSPRNVLLILHPAEPRGVHDAPASSPESETVQDPGAPGIATLPAQDPNAPETALLPCSPEPYAIGTLSECDGSTPGTGGGGATVTPGVYTTAFYSFRGDGWWGSVEMELRSFGYSGIPQYQGFWFIPYSCAIGTVAKSFEPRRRYDNLLLPLSLHVTNVSSVTCRTISGTAFTGGYYVRAVEMDGGLNLNDDDFGIRFFQPGTIPFGARIAMDELYYSAGGYPYDPDHWDNAGAGELSVAMTLQYR